MAPAPESDRPLEHATGESELILDPGAFSEPAVDALAAPVVSAPIAPEPEEEVEPDLELEPEAEPEPVLYLAPDDVLSEDAGPDPAVLGTIARLARFLGAIKSLRP